MIRRVLGRLGGRSTILVLAFLAAVLILTFVVYLPGLSGPLLLDDLPQLNGLIAQSADDPATLFRKYIVSTSGPVGRPVAMATFIGDAVAHGPDIWWWKYNNVMFHLISGLLVFWLTALLVQATKKDNSSNSWTIGIVIAGFWLLHPLHVSTVLYTVQRMTELSTLFVLAGLVSYVKGRLVQEESAGLGWLFIGVGFGVFYPLGVLSKENALLFPVYCSLIEIFVFQFRGSAPLQRHMKMLHGVLLAGYVSVAAYVLANFSRVVLEAYAIRNFTLYERVLTQFRVMLTYLDQILLPVQSKMGFFHDDIPISTGLLDPVTTLLSASILLALLVSSYLLRKKLPLYSFGILFFLVSHVLESSIFALELKFEHRNYLGSLGVLIAALAVIPPVIRNRIGLIVAVLIGLSGFSFMTWQRSLTWSTPASAYEFMYHAHPESGRLNLIFSNIYAASGDFVRARQSLAKVGSGMGPKVHGLFLDCIQYQKIDEDAMSKIAQQRDGVVGSHASSSARSLVRELTGGRCDVSSESLIALLDHLLASPIRSPVDEQSLLFTKASFLESINRIDAAVEILLAAQQLSERDAMPLYLAARTLIHSDRSEEARVMLTRATELEKNSRIQRKDLAQIAYLDIGRNYVSQDQVQEALVTYAEAISAMPGQSRFYVASAELLLQLQRYDDVEKLLASIRGLELKDIAEYDYSIRRIMRTLEKRLDESSGN